MAEIPVQRKSSMTWLWILLALILAALIIWWLASGDDEDAQVTEGAATTATEEQMVSTTDNTASADPTLAQILANPDQYMDSEYSGEVAVGDNLTDRGFWVESDGSRMFALIIDQPREVPMDINAGQQLRITNGTIRGTTSLSEIEGEALDNNTRQIAQDQEVIMVVDEEDIEILQRP